MGNGQTMSATEPEMTIGQLARRGGVHVETIRYYQRKGLMRVPDKPWGGIRRYGEDDLARLGFIRAAQHLGFTLAEIRELLKLEDGTHCAEAADIARQKLEEVRERIAQLHRMESVLAELINACDRGRGQARCPLIDSLQEGLQDRKSPPGGE